MGLPKDRPMGGNRPPDGKDVVAVFRGMNPILKMLLIGFYAYGLIVEMAWLVGWYTPSGDAADGVVMACVGVFNVLGIVLVLMADKNH
jgi:hypothetical protein